VVEAAGVAAERRRSRRERPTFADSATTERSEGVVEAAGVEPASGNKPARDPTGLAEPETSRPP